MKKDILITENLNTLIIWLSIPTIIAQIINILYNIIDRIYIGHIHDIGSSALTGVGVTFPIMMLITVFSAFAGTGGAPLASISMWKQDNKTAEKILWNTTFLLVIFAIILMNIFYIFQTSILHAFGASQVTLPYASSYLNIYLLGTVFVDIYMA